MQQPMDVQVVRDAEHLRLLSLFHYINGALTIIFSTFALFHFFLGVAMIQHPELRRGDAGSDALSGTQIGWIFVIVGGFIVISGWIFGILQIYSGRLLSERKKYLLSTVIGCINCLYIPLGTILGVLTLIVLTRPSVKSLYRNTTSAVIT